MQRIGFQKPSRKGSLTRWLKKDLKVTRWKEEVWGATEQVSRIQVSDSGKSQDVSINQEGRKT